MYKSASISCRDCIYVTMDHDGVDVDGCSKSDTLHRILGQDREASHELKEKMILDFEPQEDEKCFTPLDRMMEYNQSKETFGHLIYWGPVGGLVEFEARIKVELKSRKETDAKREKSTQQ